MVFCFGIDYGQISYFLFQNDKFVLKCTKYKYNGKYFTVLDYSIEQYIWMFIWLKFIIGMKMSRIRWSRFNVRT